MPICSVPLLAGPAAGQLRAPGAGRQAGQGGPGRALPGVLRPDQARGAAALPRRCRPRHQRQGRGQEEEEEEENDLQR